MKRAFASAIVMLVAAVTVAGCGHQVLSEGWTALIDGNDGMDNWSMSGSTANWRAEDGAIQADRRTAGKGASVRAIGNARSKLRRFNSDRFSEKGGQFSTPD